MLLTCPFRSYSEFAIRRENAGTPCTAALSDAPIAFRQSALPEQLHLCMRHLCGRNDAPFGIQHAPSGESARYADARRILQEKAALINRLIRFVRAGTHRNFFPAMRTSGKLDPNF